jgi:hypothetical protein
MDQNQPFISGIPAPQVDQSQLSQALPAVLSKAAEAGAPTLGMLTQLQQRRAARMTSVAEALRAQLGTDNPDAAAIDGTAKAVTALRTTVDSQRKQLTDWPKPNPNEWVVFGTITDPQGKPAAGLTVRVFDRDRKYDDLLGETETDESGSFSVIYHERDFKETGENLPDLYLMVSDTNGEVIFSSRDKIRYEAGRSEYFAIRLETSKPAATRGKAKPKKT